MCPIFHNFGLIVLAFWAMSASSACQGVHSRAPNTGPATIAEDSAAAPEQDAAWRKRAAVVNVDPGNSITERRSESTFTPRTSRAGVDSHTSSLLVQVAALNHIISIHKPLVEQQLREMGLIVVGMKHSKLHRPNSFNVLVEDVTYVEEVEPEEPLGTGLVHDDAHYPRARHHGECEKYIRSRADHGSLLRPAVTRSRRQLWP